MEAREHEPLTKRVRNALKDYPSDITLSKEYPFRVREWREWRGDSRRLAQSCARKKARSTGKSKDCAERKRKRGFKTLDTI